MLREAEARPCAPRKSESEGLEFPPWNRALTIASRKSRRKIKIPDCMSWNRAKLGITTWQRAGREAAEEEERKKNDAGGVSVSKAP
jgi:hypothetical protein